MTAAAPRFRLDSRRAPARAVRQAALDQLDYALASLRRGDARGIHEARKAGKRLRALLRLMRPALGRGYRAQNRRVRDAGRALAALREADALRATARSLGLGLAAGPAPQRGAQARAIRQAALLLRAQARAVRAWPVASLSRADLRDALVEGYRRARRAGRDARRRPDAPRLHEWRKQVKHHRYHSEAAAPLWPRLRLRTAALERLAETLGRHHDVEVLALELAREPLRLGALELAPATERRLRREQARMAAQALRAGAHLFEARAREWFRREIAP